MTVEKRKRNPLKRYAYYAARNEYGKVVKKYAGRYDDPAVQVLLRQQELHKAEQKAANSRDKQRVEAYKRLSVDLFEADYVGQLVYGAWNLVDSYCDKITEEEDMTTVPLEPPSDEPFNLDDFERVVRRANQGSDRAMLELREILQEQPAIWRAVGDLNAHVRKQLLHVVAGDDALLLESIDLNLTNLMNHLANETEGRFPPTIQRLLLDRVLICWLDIFHCQAKFSQVRQLRGVQEFWRKQLDRAQQRYVQAIGAAATSKN